MAQTHCTRPGAGHGEGMGLRTMGIIDFYCAHPVPFPGPGPGPVQCA